MSEPRSITIAPSRFVSYELTPEDEQQAMRVSPLFLAFLQNKIATYATAMIDHVPQYNDDPSKQMTAILEQERLRNYVAAFEELLAELRLSSEVSTTDQSTNLE